MSTFSNDRSTFARLYDREMRRVYRYIRCHVGTVEEAETLTADVFRRALVRWPRVRRQLASPRAWLMTLANDCLTHYLRRQDAQQSALPTGPAASSKADGAEKRNSLSQEASILLDRLSKLPERARAVLMLCFAGEIGSHEAGQVLNLSEGTSAVVLLRALRQLNQLYQGEKS